MQCTVPDGESGPHDLAKYISVGAKDFSRVLALMTNLVTTSFFTV